MAELGQLLLVGVVTGSLYALVAIGYTMVYGIIELINFAHGDLFMLGSFFALQLIAWLVWLGIAVAPLSLGGWFAVLTMLVAAPLFCAALNVGVDRIIYKPIRTAPKLSGIVSAIGVSFLFMNIGVFWLGPTDQNFPDLLGAENLLGEESPIRIRIKDLLVIGVTLLTMIVLTVFVRATTLGKAMRATAQNPTAAALMGINVDRVIAATFAIGGALAGFAAVVYGLFFNTVGYQMGFRNGVYAFTAAVLGGIGNIPGAVLGGILIGVIRQLASGYGQEKWSDTIIFAILITLLIFRPNGLLGARIREKV